MKKKKKSTSKIVTLSPDKVFASRMREIKKFEFNETVAEVFDDMVSRSVPFYSEVHRLILDLMRYHLKERARVYDLGCSTGTTLAQIWKWAESEKIEDLTVIGVDSSSPMIERCVKKWELLNIKNAVAVCQDINEVTLEKCDVVIMNYTLQFLAPKKRQALVKKIYRALRPGGIFILSEKLKSSNKAVDKELINLYYDFKRRNGYSELEIAQKREALEKVLIPWTQEEQMKLLKSAGFKKCEMIFRWYNFGTFIGIK